MFIVGAKVQLYGQTGKGIIKKYKSNPLNSQKQEAFRELEYLSETFLVDIGQIIVRIGRPFVAFEFRNLFKLVMGIISMIAR